MDGTAEKSQGQVMESFVGQAKEGESSRTVGKAP